MARKAGVLTTEHLVRVLDALVITPRWAKAMGTIRASEALAFSWRAKSITAAKDNDRSSIFFIEWRGAWDWWHAHAGRARTENIMTYEAAIRDQALHGVEVPVLGPDQKPVYVDDPDLIDVNDDDLWAFYGRRNRYLLDDKGHPVRLTKVEQLPAPLRLAVLRQDKRYIQEQLIDVHHSGEITTARPLQRLPGEERPDVARLRQLASMPREERLKQLNASPVPLTAGGHRTLSVGTLPPEPRPSYARPAKPLDSGERTGRGDVPDGGMKMV